MPLVELDIKFHKTNATVEVDWLMCLHLLVPQLAKLCTRLMLVPVMTLPPPQAGVLADNGGLGVAQDKGFASYRDGTSNTLMIVEENFNVTIGMVTHVVDFWYQ